METRAHHVLIGLFTLLAAGAAIFFAVWLSNASSSRAYNEYIVVFNETVTGLSPGSTVQYSGSGMCAPLGMLRCRVSR